MGEELETLILNDYNKTTVPILNLYQLKKFSAIMRI